jgi:hypothetical protein
MVVGHRMVDSAERCCRKEGRGAVEGEMNTSCDAEQVAIVVPPNVEMKQWFKRSNLDQRRDWTMGLGQEKTSHFLTRYLPLCFIPDDKHTHTTPSLLPVTVLLDYVSGVVYRYVHFRSYIRSWLCDYLFSSAVLAASSSLVCNVIVSACSGRRSGLGTYSRRAGVGQCLGIRNERPASLESFQLGFEVSPAPGWGGSRSRGSLDF